MLIPEATCEALVSIVYNSLPRNLETQGNDQKFWIMQMICIGTLFHCHAIHRQET